MKKFKKVYVEVTNVCNLDCDFCHKTKRNKEFMTIDNFKIVLSSLKDVTDYLYFHVLGEPLLHPYINELINIGSEDFKINITTNGYLLERIKDNQNIRQLNISLHSFDSRYNVSLDKYMDNIFKVVSGFENTYINYRLWVDSPFKEKIVAKINEFYHTNIDGETHKVINDKVFYDTEVNFIWPSLENNYYNEVGTCKALTDHIAILVNGDIVPCCLDGSGIIKLGNIYQNKIEDVVNNKEVINMINGFKNNKKVHTLCKKCNFSETVLK